MPIRSASITHKGFDRVACSVAILVDDQRGLYAVSGGVNSSLSTNSASRSCIEILAKSNLVRTFDSNLPDWKHILGHISLEMAEAGKLADSSDDFGATLTALAIREDQASIAHVGDCAAYLFRDGILLRLTSDQTVDRRSGENFDLFDAQDETGIYPSPLTQVLGQREAIDSELTDFRLFTEDRILLCTDGFDRSIANEDIETVLENGDDLDLVCSTLSLLAEENGAPDDFSIIALEVI